MGSTITGIESAVKVSGPGSLHLKPNREIRIEKLRIPQILPPLPEFALPFLDGFQLSILGALAVSRIPR
jgi:hypothetical protein